MSSKSRRWVWVFAAALVAAAVAWLLPSRDRVGDLPSTPEPPELQTAPAPRLEARVAEPDFDAHSEMGEPLAQPLPRDQVPLPEKRAAMDAGVASDDPASVDEKRDRMLGVVLDRLKDDLRAAQEAEDDERVERLRVRIERLEQRRSELAQP
jgi:hypothetical protein